MSLEVITKGGGNREILAMDIDEVVFPFLDQFIVWHRQEYGALLKREDFLTYEFDTTLGISVEETVKRVHGFLEHEHTHTNVTPIDQADMAIHRLNERFEIHPVTARHPMFRKVTHEYLTEHFGDVFKEITLVGHAATMDILRSKAEVCQELGAFALIDDSVSHVTGCVEVGIGGILFGNYPWNQTNDLRPDIVRCPDWPAVLEYLNV